MHRKKKGNEIKILITGKKRLDKDIYASNIKFCRKAETTFEKMCVFVYIINTGI